MDKPKFVIITSQYYDEGHTFICEYDENLLREIAKRL